MTDKKMVNLDGNEAAARIAFKLSEVMAIYPITPSSPMGEWVDAWSAAGEKNIWGTTPDVVEMQSEGGAAGAVHGAIQAGALSSTFTASQGLLLMIPNMYKIAGELTPAVFHVAARSLAYQALSIFGDHSDVMATRQTGFALLSSNSVQEAMDMALVAHAAALKASVPFLHFFDGFRTSHEISKIEVIGDDVIAKMVDDEDVIKYRDRALTPDKPVVRGTAQNPDVYFQGREVVNKYYQAVPEIVQEVMDKLGDLIGRKYKIYEYHGPADAEKVIVLMGSGAETVHETVDYLTKQGEKVGVLKVRLYRPFSATHFLSALPKSVKKIAVLDRTKESGASGEPLFQDISTVFSQALIKGEIQSLPLIIGGRYGLSSKEFTPAMVKAVFDELDKKEPKREFTVGIKDDVTNLSLDYDKHFSIESDDVFRGIFWGLGSDGTVGANKNSIKIIGSVTDNYAQAYFVYDSKKSGGLTTSYLRFGKDPIRSTYLINKANFIACHMWTFIEKLDILGQAEKGATFLINAPFEKDQVWDNLPKSVQEIILEKELKLYAINAHEVAEQTGMGRRINTIMQTAFFSISGILPADQAIAEIKNAIKKTFAKKGDDVVEQNYKAVDATIANLHRIDYPKQITSNKELTPSLSYTKDTPEFVKEVTSLLADNKGDELPVSKMPADGTFPVGTTQYEKRNITEMVPVWESDLCIQCGKCAFVCPHAAIRAKVYSEKELANAPETYKSIKAKGKYGDDAMYTIQVAVEDCTGCEICVEVCPAKDKANPDRKAINMAPQRPIRETGRANWSFFTELPDYDRSKLNRKTVKDTQLMRPLFEFSGACPGCGETPYIKLATQLFGDRMIIANATGCSSIYGGNLPTTPYTTNEHGLGPAWSNSLFEDNAEFGLGFRLTIDRKKQQATELLEKLSDKVGSDLAQAILNADQSEETAIYEQRERVAQLKQKLANDNSPEAKHLISVADYLVKKSVWIIGGDGWAYDIGYGGLDHAMASGKNINILVMDTEVYSNTGGQSSKATPTSAVAKFAANGKPLGKKDLAWQAMGYGNVYVAKVAFGANDTHTIKAFLEAESYDGPSIIIAYSHCIAHGYNMKDGLSQQKKAVESGTWPLFRYDPRLAAEGKNPFLLDSKAPKIPVSEYTKGENRFRMLTKIDGTRAKQLGEDLQDFVTFNWEKYERMAKMDYNKDK